MADRFNLAGSQVQIDFVHKQVHNGFAYTVSHLFSAVGAGADAELLIDLGALQAHTAISFACQQEATVRLYEDPTIGANGTELTPVNLHRESARASLTTTYHTPTINADGDLMKIVKVPGSSGQGPISLGSAGDSALRGTEFIFAKNEDYYIKITNDASEAQDISLGVVFYETNIPPIT